MADYQMVQVDAFSEHVFGGNPAAVLVLDEWLPDAVMQAIAEENNLAETAFAKPDGSDWALRWFTPVHEAAFCGHATLATACVLRSRHGANGSLRFQTNVGPIIVSGEADQYAMDLPRFDPIFDLHDDHPVSQFGGVEAVSLFRNFENYFIELEDEEAVRCYKPDLMGIASLAPFGLCITAPGRDVDFVSRYFAPAAGIPEDPVTGSTHATLVPHWATRYRRDRFSAFQLSRRGGKLQCALFADKVRLTGRAAIYMDAVIHL